MYKHIFKDGTEVSTKLPLEEYLKRYNRLDALRVMTEEYDEGEGNSIFQKAYRAESKNENFTGIIHLTQTEKDFIGYMCESRDAEDLKVLNFYIKGGK